MVFEPSANDVDFSSSAPLEDVSLLLTGISPLRWFLFSCPLVMRAEIAELHVHSPPPPALFFPTISTPTSQGLPLMRPFVWFLCPGPYRHHPHAPGFFEFLSPPSLLAPPLHPSPPPPYPRYTLFNLLPFSPEHVNARSEVYPPLPFFPF